MCSSLSLAVAPALLLVGRDASSVVYRCSHMMVFMWLRVCVCSHTPGNRESQYSGLHTTRQTLQGTPGGIVYLLKTVFLGFWNHFYATASDHLKPASARYSCIQYYLILRTVSAPLESAKSLLVACVIQTFCLKKCLFHPQLTSGELVAFAFWSPVVRVQSDKVSVDLVLSFEEVIMRDWCLPGLSAQSM